MAELKNHLDYEFEVTHIINYNILTELMNYNNFSLCKLFNHGLRTILGSNNRKVINHVFNNLDNYSLICANNLTIVDYFILYLKDNLLFDTLLKKFRINVYFNPLVMDQLKIEQFRILLDNKFDLNHQFINIGKYTISRFYNSLIHEACVYGPAMEIIKYLIEIGVDPNLKNSFNATPLHTACRNGRFNIIEYLISIGVNINATDKWNWQPIHTVCYYQSCETIKYFLSLPIDLNSKINQFMARYENYGLIDLIRLNCSLSDNEKNELIQLLNNLMDH